MLLQPGGEIWRCYRSVPTVACAAKPRSSLAGHLPSDRSRSGFPKKWFSVKGDAASSGLFDSAAGYPADEPIEKKIVSDRHRNGRDQRRTHQLPPVENVAANQVGCHPKRHGLLLGGGDESQRVDEFLHGQRECEDDHGEDRRY